MNIYDPSQITQEDKITATPSAINHLKKMMEKESPPPIGIQLGVKKTGCSGFQYELKPIRMLPENYHAFDQNNALTIYVAQACWPYVKKTHLDYVQEGLNQKIIFQNTRATSFCGCGESFSLQDESKI